MKTMFKAAIIVILSATFGLLFSPFGPIGAQIWPEPNNAVVPTATQGILLLGYTLLGAIAMGLALAFLVLGWGYTKRAFAGRPRLAALVHVSVVWILGNFWVHDNLHMVNGLNVDGLIAIEYTFHTTIMVASLIAMYGIVELARGHAGNATPVVEQSTSDTVAAGR